MSHKNQVLLGLSEFYCVYFSFSIISFSYGLLFVNKCAANI